MTNKQLFQTKYNYFNSDMVLVGKTDHIETYRINSGKNNAIHVKIATTDYGIVQLRNAVNFFQEIRLENLSLLNAVSQIFFAMSDTDKHRWLVQAVADPLDQLPVEYPFRCIKDFYASFTDLTKREKAINLSAIYYIFDKCAISDDILPYLGVNSVGEIVFDFLGELAYDAIQTEEPQDA